MALRKYGRESGKGKLEKRGKIIEAKSGEATKDDEKDDDDTKS